MHPEEASEADQIEDMSYEEEEAAVEGDDDFDTLLDFEGGSVSMGGEGLEASYDEDDESSMDMEELLQLPSPDHEVDDVLAGLMVPARVREDAGATLDNLIAMGQSDLAYAGMAVSATSKLSPRVETALRNAAYRLSSGLDADADIAAQ